MNNILYSMNYCYCFVFVYKIWCLVLGNCCLWFLRKRFKLGVGWEVFIILDLEKLNFWFMVLFIMDIVNGF